MIDAGHDSQAPHTRIQSGTNSDQASALAELGAMAPLYAHEMNNLMTFLSGRAQLALLHHNQPQLAQQALEAVIEGCQRAAQLSDLFLTSAGGVDSSSNKPEPKLNLEGVVDQIVSQLHHQAPQLNIIVDHQHEGYTPAVPALILRQVLDNLIRNALRAINEHPSSQSPAHRITVRLSPPSRCSTWNTPERPDQLELVVEDTGVGMDESQVAAVMREPGHPHPQPINPDHPRHGFGLRVCSLLIKQVGGTLRCESTPNVGTRMIVRLPSTKIDSNSHKRAA
jgi:two-component system NtrC family sensor kinase